MHLSVHWGVPSWEIENLPQSEFYRQYSFWKQYKWGLTDDLIAQSNVIAIKSAKVSWNSGWMLKDSALASSGYVPPVVQSADEILAAVDGFFSSL